MKILVTGCAGFIGFHLSNYLLKQNHEVFGIDNLNEYYDVNLKKARISLLKKFKNFKFNKFDLIKKNKLNQIIKKNKISYIIHLAAQAGVRYSIQNPQTYFTNNLEVFFNILEISRTNKIKHLIFASTSSVYGDNNKFPLNEKDNTDNPISFYAATKKSNEILAYSYSYIYKLPCTALRFFTVYGPLGRPDMALFKFTKNILQNKKIELFNNGKHTRDFTYIADIIDGIIPIIKKPNKDKIPFNVFNIGKGKSQKLKSYLNVIEKKLNKKAHVKKLPLQLGDIKNTHSDVSLLNKYSGYTPSTDIDEGVSNFIDWYLEFYKIKL